VADINDDPGPECEKIGPALQEIVSAVKAIPGVEAAGVTDMLPSDRDRSWETAARVAPTCAASIDFGSK